MHYNPKLFKMNTRRNFLKNLTLGAGVIVSPNSISPLFSKAKSGVHRVGILVATSSTNSEYSESFLNGVHLAFQRISNENIRFEPITEMVKFGYQSQTIRKTQHLIQNNQVNSLISLVNTDVGDRISEIAEAAKIPVVVANAGENIPSATIRKNPYLFYSSLDLCRNSALSGKLMVYKFGKNISIVSDIHDCGYDTIYSFQSAVEQAGGEITNKFINDRTDPMFFERTIQQLEKGKSDALFLLMNKHEATAFLQTYHNNGLKIPVVTTSFVTEKNLAVQLGSAANNLYHVSSWIKELDNGNNIHFVNAFHNQFSSDPDQFSFLGYQTGLLTAEIQSVSYQESNKPQVRLKNSPSGQSVLNTQTGFIEQVAYLCKTTQGSFLLPANTVIDQIETTKDFEESFRKEDENIHSGWLNPYLFV